MNNDQSTHYTEDSIINKKKDRLDELVSAHWEYQKNVLSVGQDKTQTYTWEQMMKIREWDYTSSAKHFYGHGYEDALNDNNQKAFKSHLEKRDICNGNCDNYQCD